jgi:hypothetical protein
VITNFWKLPKKIIVFVKSQKLMCKSVYKNIRILSSLEVSFKQIRGSDPLLPPLSL